MICQICKEDKEPENFLKAKRKTVKMKICSVCYLQSKKNRKALKALKLKIKRDNGN